MEIKKIGSLSPKRKIQDSVLVYSGGGICPTIRSRDYKGAIKVLEITDGQGKSNKNDKTRGY